MNHTNPDYEDLLDENHSQWKRIQELERENEQLRANFDKFGKDYNILFQQKLARELEIHLYEQRIRRYSSMIDQLEHGKAIRNKARGLLWIP